MSKPRHDPDATIEIRTFGVTFGHGQTAPPRSIVPPGQAVWEQLVYATRGVMTVRTEKGAWLVPPHRGVWIRAGVPFEVEMAGVVALRMLYIRPRRGRLVAAEPCTVVNVSPLLRELIVRAVGMGALDSTVAPQGHLIAVIRDELAALTAVPLQLPLPQDRRAVRFAALARGGDARPLQRLLRQAGASRRTMERLFRAETAMSLGQWLRREKLLEGLRRMAAGETVATVAVDLGYSSASAFIAMFRKELGQTPRRYLES